VERAIVVAVYVEVREQPHHIEEKESAVAVTFVYPS